MTGRKLRLLAIALLLPACVYMPGNTVTLEESVTPEIEADFREAAAIWRDAVGVDFTFTRRDTLGHALMVDNITVDDGDADGLFWYIQTENTVEFRLYVKSGLTHERRVRVIAHELGHWMGLEHVDAPGALMHYPHNGREVTAADMAEYERHAGQWVPDEVQTVDAVLSVPGF